ncbi:chondroitin AC/alginate lyase [Vararia minispora EC-137]|uniref:Chondroitin AC/alginate lyase n=1 Tax=Vararia minispora EC-137 TaxID=1314806 RepID=A0ACB8QPG1_9AGAM|nr:chondroitin AC/alginate lyase [Vararia minispora EC-137]
MSPGTVRRLSYSTYINTFVDPKYLLQGKFNNATSAAQEIIVQWADMLASQGPWSVTTSKNISAPSGDMHDYLSWAPYYWPDCANAGNTTELTPEQIWTTCRYVDHDGEFNPDVRWVNNTGAFGAMADAVLYNTIAWRITGKDSYASNAASYINTWFLEESTAMNPNLNYAQMIRGPNSTTGEHTGILDLKCMTKVLTGILTLRGASSSAWTSNMDTAMVNWTTSYISWMETNKLALEEASATNNHGSFYFTQLASLYLIVGNTAAAQDVTSTYFSGIYQNQISAGGEQPLEAVRTRPYHYRCYNLVAMMTNAELAAYTGSDQWNTPTANGSTIKHALDFTMGVPPGGDEPSELWLPVATGATVYGNANDFYGLFLYGKDPQFGEDPYYFWNRPSDSSAWDADAAKGLATVTSPETSSPNSTSGAGRTILTMSGKLLGLLVAGASVLVS